MRPAMKVLPVILLSTFALTQDLKIRQEAVQLLERGNSVSTSPKLPNLERVDTFRAFGDSGTKEGSFSREVIQGVGRRDELRLGDYDLLNIWTDKQVAVTGPAKLVPAELQTVARITPLFHLNFDDQNVIHNITEANVNGRAARCIEFDTVHGDRTENNEICVDAANGAILREKVGPEEIDNSEFFSFAGALMPGRISYSFGNTQKIEITQTMTELTAADANVLAAPASASIHSICTGFRRPFGISMPQPPAGNGGTTFDVMIRARVGIDGRVYEPLVQSSDRPDLNSEALSVARQWTFTPAMCNGRPDPQEVGFTLHFQGR